MASGDTHAGELLEAGVRPETPSGRLARHITTRLREAREGGVDHAEALQDLFPDTVLELETLEITVAGLLAGSHLLLLGPPGSGKTSLAKEIWKLFPKDIYAVSGCPVQDDPFSLVDAAWSRKVPPCPYCRTAYGAVSMKRMGEFDAADVKPQDVPVERTRLREGHGFARVQGSPEVFPDNLTGSINLARLEELGDPTSPLVLEPGKVLQANRGVLLVDEVGKLPRGTQNVLLQSLQEGILSPAKARETFPALTVTVTTSNLRDLGNITEPLNDRLAKIYTPFPRSVELNRRIIDIGMRREPERVAVPGPYRDAAVHLALSWRARMDGGTDLAEVGSNRTLLDILRRAQSYAILTGDAFLDPEDFHRGARDAMMARVRARGEDSWDENRQLVAKFLEKHWRESGRRGAEDYWCRFFVDELKEDKAEGVRVVQAVRDAVEKHGGDVEAIQRLMRTEGGDARVRRFARYVQAAEGIDREETARRLPAVFRSLEELGAFEEKK
jgi:energy-coupling factor transporter ATP-binding protein EcfA2